MINHLDAGGLFHPLAVVGVNVLGRLNRRLSIGGTGYLLGGVAVGIVPEQLRIRPGHYIRKYSLFHQVMVQTRFA